MKNIIKNLLVSSLLIPALSATAAAADVAATTTTMTAAAAAQSAALNPVKVIQTTIAKLNVLTQTQYTPEAMQILVNQEVAPLFDFNHITREVLFNNRVRLSEPEHQYFTKRLQKSISTALLSKLSQNNSTAFNFISARPVYGRNIIVNLQVVGYSPFSLYVDLLFHQDENRQWKIADVILNNDSLINYYQRVVAIKVRRYGVYGMLSKI